MLSGALWGRAGPSARTGVVVTAGVRVVTRPEEFVEQLAPGDILLFDKLASLNRLVQWADNRPVGHCGVWNDGVVYEATIKGRPGGATESGVFPTPLDDLLALPVRDTREAGVPLVRNITAMRHRRIDDDHRARIGAYLRDQSQSARFGIKEMVLLTPFAVERSYARETPDQVTGFITAAIRAVRRVVGYATGLGEGPERLFCSELVYRSYDHAGLPIEILDPLYDRYQQLRRRSAAVPLAGARSPGSPLEATAGAPTEASDSLLAEYGDFFEREVLAGPTEAGGLDATTLGWPGRRGRPPEFADMITPGDFWSSPDLLPVAALHRPPRS
jgi:hypothetical protein